MFTGSLQLFSFILLSAFLVVSVIQYTILKVKYRKTLVELVQARIDKSVYIDFYQKNLLDKKDESGFISESQDDFVKFLSTSRDWAFGYIEDAQRVIGDILSKTDQTIKYHKEFNSMEIEPYKTQLDTLTNAIEELKTLIPKEELLK